MGHIGTPPRPQDPICLDGSLFHLLHRRSHSRRDSRIRDYKRALGSLVRKPDKPRLSARPGFDQDDS